MKKFIPVLVLLFLWGCSSDSTSPEPPEPPFDPTAPVNPQAKGDRLFGVVVSESSAGFLEDFPVAQQAGIQVAELGLAWNDVEVSQGVYQDPDGLLAATAFYAENDISVLLTFKVIDTVGSTVPDYLAGTAWNIRSLADAFNTMAEWVFAQLPAELDVVGVAIGNEVNYVLEGDEWAEYGEFYTVTAGNLHTLDASLKVGIKTTVSDGLFGLTRNNILALNELTDVVMLNYYLQDGQFQVRPTLQVHNDFTTIAGEFSNRDIWLTEVGFQSGSEFCLSSEDKQAAFYHEIFTAWDTHKYFFKYLMVNWLNDASPAQLAEWEQYYGSSDPAFLEYLGTLGLRTHAGEDKNAWTQLLAETEPRGWIAPSGK